MEDQEIKRLGWRIGTAAGISFALTTLAIGILFLLGRVIFSYTIFATGTTR